MSEYYPGLDVTDNVATTSITVNGVGLWALTGRRLADEGWDSIASDYGLPPSFTREDYYTFLHHLLECRGEFARLICILADVEREESEAREHEDWAWWETERKGRVVEQLKRCVRALEEYGNPWGRNK